MYRSTWNFEPVAIKEISRCNKEKDYFEKEVSALSKINSRYVVRLIGICNPYPYTIVLEYMEGGALSDYIKTESYKKLTIAGIILDLIKWLFICFDYML